MGVEPTGDGIARRPPVLKTGTITGPHALPHSSDCKAVKLKATEVMLKVNSARGYVGHDGRAILGIHLPAKC